MPLTVKAPPPVEATVPAVVVPSPQSIVAVKSPGRAPPRPSVKLATTPLNAAPSVAAMVRGNAVRPLAAPTSPVLVTVAVAVPGASSESVTMTLKVLAAA